MHVAITASCNISENAYTDDFRKEGDVMVQMAVHALLFPEKAEGAIYKKKKKSDKYILKGILSSVTLHSPDKERRRRTGSLECIRRHCHNRAYCNISMLG